MSWSREITCPCCKMILKLTFTNNNHTVKVDVLEEEA